MYKPEHFELYELLPKDFYEVNKGKGDLLWYIFDDRVLWTMDMLREKYGAMGVNDWKWGGPNQYRGWRPFYCTVGAFLSQHKFGRAVDLIPSQVSVYEIREDIKTDPGRAEFKYITCIEEGVSWLHFDVRNWDKDNEGLKTVTP